MRVVGLDIGGANIKAADAEGRSLSRVFEIWKSPECLSDVLAEVLAQFLPFDLVAVTMTAELADCFQTKGEGVAAILTAVEEAARSKPVYVWQTGAEFVSPAVARDIPLLVAAANWHSLATFVGRMAPAGSAVLIDVGTTTTDIIPLLDGVPVPQGLTDCERLQSGELVYSGVRRTPLCAVAHTVPFRGGYCPLAAELFATTLDVYLTLGDIAEDRDDCATANGRPATREAAHDRLARMLCCDRSEFSGEDAQSVGHFLADVQKQRLAGALSRVLSKLERPCEMVLVSGSGSFLARRLVADSASSPAASEQPGCCSGNAALHGAAIVALAESFGPGISETACAFAVARLAEERLDGID